MDSLPGFRLGLSMLSVVCWRWGTRYGVEWVNRLRSMVSRHLSLPHRFFCITDNTQGYDSGIELVPMWDPQGLGRCRRLRIYEPSMEAIFGKRILQLDIDGVVTGDLTPLVDRPDPFVIWRSVPDQRYVGGKGIKANSETGMGAYNASAVLMDTGVFPTLWGDYLSDRFGLEKAAKKAGFWTSLYNAGLNPPIRQLDSGDDDQAIVSLYARKIDAPTWMEKDGLYKVGRRGFSDKTRLPENSRLVFFNGSLVGNRIGLLELPWVKEHWR